MHEGELRYCAVCTETLAAHYAPGALSPTGWAHKGEVYGEPVDHPAVPVEAVDVRRTLKCDFCSGPNPMWGLPVAQFDLNTGVVAATGAGVVQGSVGEWAACEVCARLVRRDRWDALVDRVAAAMAAKHNVSPSDPALLSYLRGTYARVREHRRGDLRRLNPDG